MRFSSNSMTLRTFDLQFLGICAGSHGNQSTNLGLGPTEFPWLRTETIITMELTSCFSHFPADPHGWHGSSNMSETSRNWEKNYTHGEKMWASRYQPNIADNILREASTTKKQIMGQKCPQNCHASHCWGRNWRIKHSVHWTYLGNSRRQSLTKDYGPYCVWFFGNPVLSIFLSCNQSSRASIPDEYDCDWGRFDCSNWRDKVRFKSIEFGTVSSVVSSAGWTVQWFGSSLTGAQLMNYFLGWVDDQKWSGSFFGWNLAGWIDLAISQESGPAVNSKPLHLIGIHSLVYCRWLLALNKSTFFVCVLWPTLFSNRLYFRRNKPNVTRTICGRWSITWSTCCRTWMRARCSLEPSSATFASTIRRPSCIPSWPSPWTCYGTGWCHGRTGFV